MGPGLGLEKGSKSEERLQQRWPLSGGVIAGAQGGRPGAHSPAGGEEAKDSTSTRVGQAQAREKGDLRQGRCPRWTPVSIQNHHAGASGTLRIIWRMGLGESPAVSPTRTPSQLTHMSSGESGQQGPQGLCTGPELGEREQVPLPSVIPRLLAIALLPRATTAGAGRPHPRSLLDPLARAGGPVGAVTPRHSMTTPHTWPRAPPRHAVAAVSGEK